MPSRQSRSLAGFQAGDVVVRLRTGVSVAANATINGGTVGTICRVVNAGRSYMVRYADVPLCVLVFQSSLAAAPAGTEGPECEADC
ncbi:MAG: hypothetical protein ACK4PH_01760 [Aquincola tertiaricarbonis]